MNKRLAKYVTLLSLTGLLICTPIITLANTILVLGDSISAAYGIPVESGWVNLLQKRLDKYSPHTYTVVNSSITGETTAGGLVRLPALLDKHKPSQVIVELGGNDGLRGLSLQAMQSNLQTIIDQSKKRGATVTLLSIELPTSYGVVFNRRFQQVFDRLETANNIPRVSLGFDLLNDRNLLQEDGVHPTAAAQPLLLEAVWPSIKN